MRKASSVKIIKYFMALAYISCWSLSLTPAKTMGS